MPQFSVIIPLYNKQTFIKKTVESVLNQTFTDYEIIVVDDCSTDKSLLELQKINSTKINLIHHSKNKGLSESRNTGIKNSNGNYIAFLDADDIWKENFLKNIADLITEFPQAKIFATNYEEVIRNKRILLPKNNNQNLSKNTLINNYFEIAICQPLYCPSSICYEKSVFEKIGFFNPKLTFAEDIDFNIRVNLKFSIAYSKTPLVQYLTFSENQITQNIISKKRLVDLDFYEDSTNIPLKKFLDFHRYIFAKMYHLEGNLIKYKELKQKINLSNLNKKQIILLFAPRWILKKIKKIKMYWLHRGIRITTYN